MDSEMLDEYYRLLFLTNRLYERYARTLGESAQVLFLMRLLLAHPEGMRQRDICECLAAPKQTMSRVLRGLEGRGHVAVRPSPVDGRERLFSLTRPGTEYAERLVGALSETETECVRALGPNGLRTLNGLNASYLEAFENKMGELEGEGK